MATTAFSGKSMISGFAGVLGPDADNQFVFERCLLPRLRTVLRGGCTSLFCYGYTGGGKTHTVIGYGAERGLYFHAAQHLLRELQGAAGQAALFLHATACEVYNDAVFDLLGAEKLECTLLADESGQLQVRRAAMDSVKLESETSSLLGQLSEQQLKEMHEARDSFDERGVPSRFNGTVHSTVVTRTERLRSVSIFSPEDLEEISRSYVQQRAVGTSTQHEQSSRSHAMLRIEVVNAALVEARQALDQARAQLPPLKNSLDNVTNVACKLLFDGPGHALMTQEVPPIDDPMAQLAQSDALIWDPVDLGPAQGDGCWLIAGSEGDAEGTKFRLVGFPGEAKSSAGWAEHLGLPQLHYNKTFAKKHFDVPGLWESKHAALRAQKDRIQAALVAAEAEVQRTNATVAELMARGPASLGGSLVLVDLAGADYDHRAGRQQKESAAINKSLLALKECLRVIAKGTSQRPKFRDSKLTRLMEDSLAPTSASWRHCRESVSVMLVSVSPAAQLERMTLNALRYGQLFADGYAAGAASRAVPSGGPAQRRGSGGAAGARKKVAACMNGTGLEASGTNVTSVASAAGGNSWS